jgi:NTE family protein
LPSFAIVDFDRLPRQLVIKLFLCATNAQTGKVEVCPKRPGADRVLASTCLPLLMHSVDGEVYWDGWFSGSPVIFPLVYECETRGIVMVHLTPAERSEGTSEDRRWGKGMRNS